MSANFYFTRQQISGQWPPQVVEVKSQSMSETHTGTRPDVAGMGVPPPLLYAVPLIAGIAIGSGFRC
jgi:hypothetical protein